jgi:hypothetical protein
VRIVIYDVVEFSKSESVDFDKYALYAGVSIYGYGFSYALYLEDTLEAISDIIDGSKLLTAGDIYDSASFHFPI